MKLVRRNRKNVFSSIKKKKKKRKEENAKEIERDRDKKDPLRKIPAIGSVLLNRAEKRGYE